MIFFGELNNWLVVEPTHLKNMSQIGFVFPKEGMNIKNIWVATTQTKVSPVAFRLGPFMLDFFPGMEMEASSKVFVVHFWRWFFPWILVTAERYKRMGLKFFLHEMHFYLLVVAWCTFWGPNGLNSDFWSGKTLKFRTPISHVSDGKRKIESCDYPGKLQNQNSNNSFPEEHVQKWQ